MRHPRLRPIILSTILALSVAFWPAVASAQSVREVEQQLKQAQAEAAKYKALQAQEAQAANKYAADIARVEAAMQSLQRSLDEILKSIAAKERDIAAIQADIDRTKTRLDQLTQEKNEAIVQLYELSQVSTIEIMARYRTLSAHQDSNEYVSSLQDHLTLLAQEVTNAKLGLEDKHRALESERAALAQLKGEQESQMSALESQKQQSSQLLAQSEDRQARYEELAHAAEGRKQSFNQQLAQLVRAGTRAVRKGSVKRGQVIGHMGSTGFCYAGYERNTHACAHVHFEVMKNGQYLNPRALVPGQLAWPLDSFYVTQEYGANWTFPNGQQAYRHGHSGIDIVSNSGYGAPVRAAGDGVLIELFPDYNGYMPDGYGYYRIIDHGNGYVTLYGHLTN